MNNVLTRKRQIWITCLVTLLLGCNSNPKKDTPAPPPSLAARPDIQIKDPKPYPFTFVAYGDMRFAEKESYGIVIANGTARRQIIDQIANESPAFLVATGDFVFRGFHSEDWTYFDQGIKPVRDRGIEIFPAIGNHEVGPFPSSKYYESGTFKEIEKLGAELMAHEGLKNYYKEFPSISHKPWYSVRYANCYFLILDSEADDVQSTEQDQWIRAQLDSIPSEIDYVFVVLHRPPYTALTDDTHRPRPQQVALAKLLEDRQPKSRAHIIVIAGHVHNYERYQHNGVAYIVSGGGGAKPVTIAARSADDLYPKNDLFGKNDPVDEPQYHYCTLTVDHTQLKFQMMKLVSKGTHGSFEPRDSFEMDIPVH
jgi:hypothetical protein